MTVGEEFKLMSADVVSDFASHGLLLQPTTDTYNPITGEQSHSFVPIPLEYVIVDNRSKASTVLKASSFRQRLVYFTTNAHPDETWGFLVGVTSDNYTQWVSEIAELWIDETDVVWIAPNDMEYTVMDIKSTEKIEVADVVVGYYALLEYRE